MRCRFLLVLAALLAVTQLPADEPTDRPGRIGFVGRALRLVHRAASPISGSGCVSYVEGKNLYAERRWAGDRTDDLPRLIVEVLQHHVDLIVTYGTSTAIAAKNATSSIPIVAAVMADPIRGTRLLRKGQRRGVRHEALRQTIRRSGDSPRLLTWPTG